MFSASEQAFFAERGFGDPVRCLACRRALKAKKAGADPSAAAPRPNDAPRRPGPEGGFTREDRPRRDANDEPRRVDPPGSLGEAPSRAPRQRDWSDDGFGAEGKGWSGSPSASGDRPGKERRREPARGRRDRRGGEDDFDY
jgi:hypothetical protein